MGNFKRKHTAMTGMKKHMLLTSKIVWSTRIKSEVLAVGIKSGCIVVRKITDLAHAINYALKNAVPEIAHIRPTIK